MEPRVHNMDVLRGPGDGRDREGVPLVRLRMIEASRIGRVSHERENFSRACSGRVPCCLDSPTTLALHQRDFSGHMTLISGASSVFVPCLVKVHVFYSLALPSKVLDVQAYFFFFTTTFALLLLTILVFTLWAFFKNFYPSEAGARNAVQPCLLTRVLNTLEVKKTRAGSSRSKKRSLTASCGPLLFGTPWSKKSIIRLCHLFVSTVWLVSE